MGYRRGDRVRIKNPSSEYTGCRGTIADDPAPGVAVLGHHVAIDGENGITRPFLLGDLEPLRPARVGSRSGAARPREREGRTGTKGAEASRDGRPGA
ncbi:MAG TPA: hypothetical protein VKA74_04325 [Myxococcota bacterium]|nr:hypothetical protein [Myxococcota bacterium]